MTRRSTRILALVGTAAVVGTATVATTRSSTSPDAGLGRTIVLAERTQTARCHRGPVPDPQCSPGAYYSKLTKGVICSPTFHTGDVRSVPQSLKFSVEREYGMEAKAYGSALEIDHIVSLELGGSNDIANLFPESGSGRLSYHLKDKLENKLHQLVCSGKLGIRAARAGIATDWRKLYVLVFGELPPA